MFDDECEVAQDALQGFIDRGLISEVLEVVKSGKEAAVHRCRACPSTGAEFLAAKVYRPLEFRSFRNDAVYQEGRTILDARSARAFRKKSRYGRSVQFGNWAGVSDTKKGLFIKNHEFEALSMLHGAGAGVPRPFAWEPGAVLMEFIGDAGESAPLLHRVELPADEAGRLFAQIMRNVELFLACNRVHGDLSAFNMLYWRGRLAIIDFPQAVDPRVNRNAYALLRRDVENVCKGFARYGVKADAAALAAELWSRWLTGETK
jgi:RIO kinase 1